ncbi:MAG: helix-turn-helix transcriptional regulator [Gemmatimonadales bacterium]|nr:helix-turn-helix transcriptional regulator [Gemmatimonadales bacterium]MDZ4390434.1 helix-turn-helix transcriptional regulator [Gemmatimonadales bacterium]
MLGHNLYSHAEIATQLAARVARARLDAGWSQAELAERAGITLATYRRFEQTGKISLDRLIRVMSVLGRGADWAAVCAPRPPLSIEDVEATWRVRQRAPRRPAEGPPAVLPRANVGESP